MYQPPPSTCKNKSRTASPQQTRQNTPAASQDPSAEQHDDGLVHGHSWAYAQGEKDGPVGLRQGATVADASSIRTPSSAVHDDLHYS